MLNQGFRYLCQGASGLGLISSVSLDVRKEIQSVKLAFSKLYLELKSHLLPPFNGNNKEVKLKQ